MKKNKRLDKCQELEESLQNRFQLKRIQHKKHDPHCHHQSLEPCCSDISFKRALLPFCQTNLHRKSELAGTNSRIAGSAENENLSAEPGPSDRQMGRQVRPAARSAAASLSTPAQPAKASASLNPRRALRPESHWVRQEGRW